MRIFLASVLFIFDMSCVHAAQPSTCYGTTANGRIEHAWQLPSSGDNYEAYSFIGVAAGRNYVHSSIYEVVLDAYKILHARSPDKHFVYGETGSKSGGKFSPHKTHQNGLSIDFFVPVVDANGKSVPLPTSAFNKLGYNIEFSNKGKYKDYSIDFDAMAEHLLELKKAADSRGIKIWRVIFDNELQHLLFATPKGQLLKSQMQFSTKKPWVRHDEHYHVDFELMCKAEK